MNRYRLKMDRQEKRGIAFGEAASISSPPSRSQMDGRAESGFGGWVDEKIETVREAAPLLSRKKVYPQHLTIAQILVQFVIHRYNSSLSYRTSDNKRMIRVIISVPHHRLTIGSILYTGLNFREYYKYNLQNIYNDNCANWRVYMKVAAIRR